MRQMYQMPTMQIPQMFMPPMSVPFQQDPRFMPFAGAGAAVSDNLQMMYNPNLLHHLQARLPYSSLFHPQQQSQPMLANPYAMFPNSATMTPATAITTTSAEEERIVVDK